MKLGIQARTSAAAGRSAAVAGQPAGTSLRCRHRLVATELASPIQSQSHRINVDGEAGS